MQALDFHVSKTLKVQFFSMNDGGRRPLAVTFTPSNNKQLDGTGFGGDFLLKSGFDVLAFKSSVDGWFQEVPAELFSAINAFVADRGHERRVGYGSSMGGFAAIAFSGRLKLDTVLACSPQFAIDQAFDKRWAFFGQQLAWRYRIDAAALGADCRYFVWADSQDADWLHVDRLRALIAPSRLHVLALPHSGHPCLQFLHEARQLKPAVLDVLRGDSLGPQLHRHARRDSKTYWKSLSRRLLTHRRPHAALAAAHAAVARDERDPTSIWLKAKVLQVLGREDEARQLSRQMLGDGEHPRRLFQLSRRQMQAEQWVDALSAIDAALAMAPGSAQFHMQRAQVLSRTGRMGDAVQAAREAHFIATDDPEMNEQLGKLLLKIDDLPGAREVLAQALASGVRSAGIFLHLSAALLKQGRLNMALRVAEDSLRHWPEDQRLQSHLARLQARVSAGGARHRRRPAGAAQVWDELSWAKIARA